MDANDDNSQPLNIQMLVDIIDLISSPEYRALDDNLKDGAVYMTNTLIFYILNIFFTFVKVPKKFTP